MKFKDLPKPTSALGVVGYIVLFLVVAAGSFGFWYLQGWCLSYILNALVLPIFHISFTVTVWQVLGVQCVLNAIRSALLPKASKKDS